MVAGMALSPIPDVPNTPRAKSANLAASVGPIALGAAYPIYDANAVEVYLDGVLQPSGWSLVSISGASLPWDDAQLTFTSPKTGRVDIIGASIPYTKETFVDGGILARGLNYAFRRVTAALRELWDRFGRTVQVKPSQTAPVLDVDALKGGVLGIDSLGKFVKLTIATGLAISARGLALITAGSSSAAQAALYDFGGVGNGIANDAGAMADELALGGTVKPVADKTWLFQPNAAQAAIILANIQNVDPDEVIRITLPIGKLTSSAAPIMELGPEAANIEIVGATPTITALDPGAGSAVLSMGGTNGLYTGVYRCTAVDPSWVGAGAKFFRTAPTSLLFGDDQSPRILRGRPLQGELCQPSVCLGSISAIQSTGTATFSPTIYAFPTISIGSDLWSIPGHSFKADDCVYFTVNTGTPDVLPTNFAFLTRYYVLADGLAPDNLKLSLTKGGAAITATVSQSGTHVLRIAVETIIPRGTLIIAQGQCVRCVGGYTVATCNITPGWSHSIQPSLDAYYIALSSDGLIETSGSSDDVIGIGTLATTQANIGSICLFIGDAAEVIGITDDGHWKLAKAQTIAKTSGTFTVATGTPGTFTKVAHGYAAWQAVYLTTTGALLTGLAVNTPYYVSATGLATDTFQLAATIEGASIATSGTQSGTHTIHLATPFAFIHPGSAHDGGGMITAVDTLNRTITVTRQHLFKPPVNGILAGEVTIIPTVLEQTGAFDGLKFGQRGSLSLLDNVVLLGGPASLAAIAMAGRVSAGVFGDATQRSFESVCMLGPNVLILNFATAAYVPHGCKLDARMLAEEGQRSIAIWNDGGFINLRRASQVGCKSSIALQNNGETRFTELRSSCHAGDALRREPGARCEAEMALFHFNGGMDMRLSGAGDGVIQHFISWCCRLSGAYGLNSSAELNRGAILGPRREGVELDGPGDFVVDRVWIAGMSGLVGSGHGVNAINGARPRGQYVGIVGGIATALKGIAIFTDGPDTRAVFPGLFARRNLTRSAKATNRARIYIPNSNIDGVEVDATGRVFHDGASVTNSPTGVPRVNEQTVRGGGVFDANATAIGMAAFRVNGGAVFNKFDRATASLSFGLIADGARDYTEIPIPGVTATNCTVSFNLSAVPPVKVRYYTLIIDPGQVRLYCENTSGSGHTPSAMTATVSAQGNV